MQLALEQALPKLLTVVETSSSPEVIGGLVRTLNGVPPSVLLLSAVAGAPGVHREVGGCLMSRWSTYCGQVCAPLVCHDMHALDLSLASAVPYRVSS